MLKDRIQRLIERIIPVCSSWMQEGQDGLLRFLDPLDGEEISAHYGATHVAAAYITWGKQVDDINLYQRGLKLLRSILERWDKNLELPAYHFDFNNFALLLVEPLVDAESAALIRKTINKTEDSHHDTINWLPMRWAVNKKRIVWTSNVKYEAAIARCRKLIAEATNADGGIEDRLPHGKSFNLQYDLATVAGLQYLRVQGEELDLGKELGFLLNAVAPDGDVNYQGRGTNQVFAWGLWVYLLASSGQHSAMREALDFFEPRLEQMLDNKSMMLNGWDGKEKYLWWDYHYASVYTAHCLLWLVMSIVDFGKKTIQPIFPSSSETGLHICKSDKHFVSWFEGRSEYLAEKGPAVAAIWSQCQGMICKGTFAPWQGPFGNKYIYEDVVLKNYCGLLRMKRNIDWSKARYVHKLMPHLESAAACTFQPIFCPISVEERDGAVEITWRNDGEADFVFNLPAVSDGIQTKLVVDGNEVPLFCNSAIKNQYGWVYLHQSRKLRGKQITMIVK